jgi:hypothetical protein
MNLAAFCRTKGNLLTDAGPEIPEDLAGMYLEKATATATAPKTSGKNSTKP